jgi:hypothetical protein
VVGTRQAVQPEAPPLMVVDMAETPTSWHRVVLTEVAVAVLPTPVPPAVQAVPVSSSFVTREHRWVGDEIDPSIPTPERDKTSARRSKY